MTTMSRAQYLPLVQQYAAQYGVPLWLAEAQIQQESGWNPNARSPAGAGGIMQFMPGTGADYGLSPIDRFTPEKAIPAGMKHMRDLLDMFGGDERLALAAYNAGQGAVKKHGGVPPYKETQDYVERIMRARPTDTRMAATDPVGEMPVSPYGLPDRYGVQPQMSEPSGIGLHPLVQQMQQQQQKQDPLSFLRAAAGIFSADPARPLDWLGQGIAGFAGPQGNKLDMLEGLQASNELYKLEESRRNAGLVAKQRDAQQRAMAELAAKARAEGNEPLALQLEANMATKEDLSAQFRGPEPPDYALAPKDWQIGQWEDGSPKYMSIIPAKDGTEKQIARPQGWQPVSAMPQDPLMVGKVSEARQWGELGPKKVEDINSQLSNATAGLAQTNYWIKELESGKYDDNLGPIMGPITSFFSPETARAQSAAVTMALDNLQITNLAPVTERELALVTSMAMDTGRTAKQNAAVLRRIKDLREFQIRAARKAIKRIRDEGYSAYALNPETPEIPVDLLSDPLAPDQGSAPAGQPQEDPQRAQMAKRLGEILGIQR